MKVRWTEQADADTDDIGDYISHDNPRAAERVVLAIEATGEGLGHFPSRGRPGRVGGTREMTVRGLPYLLIYRVGATEVEILRVLHGARAWPPETGD